jgi:hypothetical protein
MNEHLTKALHDLEFARESLVLAGLAAELRVDGVACGIIEDHIAECRRMVSVMLNAPPSAVIKVKGEG